MPHLHSQFAELILETENNLDSFLSLFHNTCIFIFDADGLFTFGHSNVIPKLMFEPEQFLNKSVSDLFSEEISKSFHNAIALNKRKEISVFTYSLTMMDSLRWYEAKCSPIFKDGYFDGSLAIVRDITDEKLIREEKQNKEVTLEKMVKSRTRELEEYKSHLEDLVTERTERFRQTISLLRKEIEEKNYAEERAEHLNQMLNAIRSINLLITQITDKQKLINKACLALVKTRGYNNVIITLTKDNQIYLTSSVADYKRSTGNNKTKSKNKKIPEYLSKILSSAKPHISKHTNSLLFKFNSEAKFSSNIISCRLENQGKIFGVLHVNYSGTGMLDSEELSLFMEICSDIAFAIDNIEHEKARQKTNFALEKSNKHFKALFENSGMAILFLGDDIILEANQKLADIFSTTVEKVKGMHPYVLSPDLQPDGQKSRDKAIEKINAAIAGEQQEFRWIHKRMNGEEFPAEVTLTPVTIGQETFIQAIVKDTTVRDKAEKALKKSETNYKSLTNNVPIGLFRSNPIRSSLLSVNPAMISLFGFDTAEEMLKISSSSLFLSPEYRADFLNKLNKNKLLEGYETQMAKKDGTSFWASISAKYIPNDDNKTIFIIDGIISDISAKKAHQEQVEKTMATLHKAIEGTVTAMSKLVEMKDPYTAGHQKGVAHLACAIGKEMNLPEDTIDCLRIASILHDLGKLNVPLEILNKPGPLNKFEMNFVHDHSQAGYDILKGIEFPWPIAETILQHHEKCDGSGYPNGLICEEIRIEAAIIAVADVVDAVASKRPYRASKGLEHALTIIKKGSGSKFKSEVVEACLRLFAERNFVLLSNDQLTGKINFVL